MAYQQLSILHVSDVHTSFDNIHKLQQWIEANNQNLDMILVSGDIADMPMEYGFDESDEALLFKKSYYDDMLKVVDAIAKIHGRVYYIPGNHDVPQAFITTASDSPSGPLNVHLQTIPVASGLSLAGLGGSVPGYKEGKHLWDGFPYTSEDLIQKDLMQLLDPLVKDGSTDQFILMTHVGPISSGTTIATDDPKSVITSGSSSLNEWLLNDAIQKKVIINVHGHTHGGFGEVQLGKISIINPGPLMDGHFSIYTLTYDSSKWCLSSVKRHKLL